MLVKFLVLLCAVLAALTQKSCKSGECGPEGNCRNYRGGDARCECGKGWMGLNCKRPCQDVFKSCKRWKQGGRCEWHRLGRTLFFMDNCAASCQSCQFDEKNQLEYPFHPLLEQLEWLVGHWETQTSTSQRFPMDTLGPYKETLMFQPSNVTMFDRPSLNFTYGWDEFIQKLLLCIQTQTALRPPLAIAQTIGDPTDLHWDVGFMTSKLVIEDTGFRNKDRALKDEVGLEINSNTGINTVEEGDLKDSELNLTTTWTKALPFMEGRLFKQANRTFRSAGYNQLEEHTVVEMSSGETKSWTKFFTRVKDVLQPLQL